MMLTFLMHIYSDAFGCHQCCRDPDLVADVFLRVLRDLRVAAQNY